MLLSSHEAPIETRQICFLLVLFHRLCFDFCMFSCLDIFVQLSHILHNINKAPLIIDVVSFLMWKACIGSSLNVWAQIVGNVFVDVLLVVICKICVTFLVTFWVSNYDTCWLEWWIHLACSPLTLWIWNLSHNLINPNKIDWCNLLHSN